MLPKRPALVSRKEGDKPDMYVCMYVCMYVNDNSINDNSNDKGINKQEKKYKE